jgi:hypothetical protein
MQSTADGHPTFSRDAVLAWAKSMGISDHVALEFMEKAGAQVVDGICPVKE